MTVEPKAYPLEGKLKCISDKTLVAHRDVLYKGYVTHYNKVQEAIGSAELDNVNPHFSEYSEAKRRESWTHNGVILHDFYFQNLGGQGSKPGERTRQLASRDFGSVEGLVKHVTATGISTGVGWAVWAWSPLDRRTHVYGLDEHQNNCPIAVTPLLVLDVFEHAYYADRFTDRAAYIKEFWGDLDWAVVERRASDVPK
jgi:Fe-Mn family superoxide dismutase